MPRPMILEHVNKNCVPDELDPREYGFYKAVFDVDPTESIGATLFAASDSVRKRTLNSELVKNVDNAGPGELVHFTNRDISDALGWNPSAVTRVSQSLDGITLIRVNDVMKSGKRIFPLEPVLKNYSSRVLNLRPIHMNEVVLTMMDFIATNYHQDESLYEHGVTLPLIERLYNAIQPPERIYPEVREDGNSGYYEIVVQSREVKDETVWEQINSQCKTYSNMLGSLALAGTEQSDWKSVTNKIEPTSCDCTGRCVHYAVHLMR